MRSNLIKKIFERVQHRSLLRATGQIKDKQDFSRLFIGVLIIFIGKLKNTFRDMKNFRIIKLLNF